MGLLGLIVLLPINVHGGNNLQQFEKLSMSNVQDGSVILWAHWVLAYLLGLLVLYLLYQEYGVVSRVELLAHSPPTIGVLRAHSPAYFSIS